MGKVARKPWLFCKHCKDYPKRVCKRRVDDEIIDWNNKTGNYDMWSGVEEVEECIGWFCGDCNTKLVNMRKRGKKNG